MAEVIKINGAKVYVQVFESTRRMRIGDEAEFTGHMLETVWITITMENSGRDGNTRPPDLPLEKPVCRSGSNS